MMKKLILALTVALAVLLGVSSNASAAASLHSTGCDMPSGNHIYLALWADVGSGGNGDLFDSFAWSNDYNLDRVAVSWRQDSGHSFVVVGAAGGTSTSQNDVDPSSSGAYTPSDWPKRAPGSGGEYRITVWGGAGNSNESCNSGTHDI